MLKKFLAKKASKKLLKFAAKKEGQILMGAAATMVTHKVLQKAAEKYPALKFFKSTKKVPNS